MLLQGLRSIVAVLVVLAWGVEVLVWALVQGQVPELVPELELVPVPVSETALSL